MHANRRQAGGSGSPVRAVVLRAEFGRRLRRARQARILQLKDLAADLEVTTASVSAWERGLRFPSVEHLVALAACLGVSMCDLVCHPSAACPPDCRSRPRSTLS